MKFYGSTKQGRTIITNRDQLLEHLKSIEGDFVLKVTATKDIRTLKMNDLYWFWLSLLSEESGYSKRQIHNYFKNELLCIEDEVKGEKIMDCRSTSDLTIKEFSEYLLNVGRIASESFSFYLPYQDQPLKYGL